MAVGFPTKANWAAGDVLTAAQMDDLAGTLNTVSAPLYNAAGKNAIINGAFNVWQRGTSISLSNGAYSYTADRFTIYAAFSAGTCTASQQTFTPGTAPVAGYEGTYFLRLTNGSTATYFEIDQGIEDTRTFAGQTVTLSFWGKASSAVTITPQFNQTFGTGGSSAVVTFGLTASLTTSWQRFTATVSLPSVSGKTIGTNSYLQVMLTASGTLGSIAVDIWGVQLEAGSTATGFQTATGTLQELAACQRYYWRSTSNASNNQVYAVGSAVTSTVIVAPVFLPVQMRTLPQIISYSNVNATDETTNFAPSAVIANSRTSMNILQIQLTVTGATQFRPYYVVGNATAGYIDASAEL